MKDTGKLKVTAQSEREIVMTRDFDAPRRLVFDALTKPELLKRWLGVFGGWELAVCDVDLKVGGAYRYVWRRSSDGSEMGLRRVYREIVPPERLLCTGVFGGARHPGEPPIPTPPAEHGRKTPFTRPTLHEPP